MQKKMKKGQTMVEYIIIVCLIAVALIGVFSIFGKGVKKKVAGATEAISTTEGAKAQQEANKDINIKDIGEN